MTSSTVSKRSDYMNDVDALGSVTTLADMQAFLKASGIEIHDTSEFGDGFAVTDKATLVNVPFLIVGYKFASGDYGDMVIVHAITNEPTPRKVIFTDGSSGIKAQCELYASKDIKALTVRDGLIRSDFRYVENGDGTTTVVKANDERFAQAKPATTYYLS